MHIYINLSNYIYIWREREGSGEYLFDEIALSEVIESGDDSVCAAHDRSRSSSVVQKFAAAAGEGRGTEIENAFGKVSRRKWIGRSSER